MLMLVAGSAASAAPALTAAMAEHMSAACVSYARSRHGAVNIWVYDRDGEVLHFERMDGAPLIGAAPGTLPPGLANATPFGSAIDPNASDPADPGDVPVRVAGQPAGRVRVSGMGAAPDRACAETAARAATP